MSGSGADKARIVGAFDRASTTYERVGPSFFTPFGRRLVEVSGIGPGDRVLDVGCGSGAVLLPAAEAVTPGGHVTAIDLAPGMVDRARDAVAGLRSVEIDVRLGDAERPEVPPAAFDAVLAGLVLFFLPDLTGALAAYREALRPGGTLAVSTFGPPDPRWDPVVTALSHHVPGPAPRQGPRQGGPFSSAAALGQVLEDAGFDHVQHVEDVHHVVFTDAEEWLAWSWSHGRRAMWEAIAPGDRSVAEADVRAALDSITRSVGALSERVMLRCTTARRP